MGTSITASKITPLRQKTRSGASSFRTLPRCIRASNSPECSWASNSPPCTWASKCSANALAVCAPAKMKSARASTNSSRCPPVTAHLRHRT